MTDPDQYDAMLAAVPLPLVAALAWSWVASVGVTLALGAGSLVAAAPLAYALFVQPPA